MANEPQHRPNEILVLCSKSAEGIKKYDFSETQGTTNEYMLWISLVDGVRLGHTLKLGNRNRCCRIEPGYLTVSIH